MARRQDGQTQLQASPAARHRLKPIRHDRSLLRRSDHTCRSQQLLER
jgi:hypothetical protein